MHFGMALHIFSLSTHKKKKKKKKKKKSPNNDNDKKKTQKKQCLADYFEGYIGHFIGAPLTYSGLENTS